MIERLLESEAETLAVAVALGGVLAPGDVVGLEGGLGAGKTTFARGAIHGLGLPDETAVTSPTFALLHRYEGRLPIGHLDLYRLTHEDELFELGLDELIDEGGVLLVEWGRKFASVREQAVLWVELELVSDQSRRLRIIPEGPRGEALVGALRPA